MSNRILVRVALISALYVVFTIGLAPISFGPIQFRISEALKVFCLFSPWYALGIGIGTLLANMVSPFVGPWELIWMPMTDILGGVLAFYLYQLLRNRLAFIPLGIYAITTGLAVGIMLVFLGVGNFLPLTIPIIASELIILWAGAPLIFFIEKMLRIRGILLVENQNKTTLGWRGKS